MLTKKDWNIIIKVSLVDFKLKYSSSILGFFWSLLNPLLMLTTLYVVFSILIKNNIEHYSLFLLLGIILWNFFAECTLSGMSSVLSKASLISKIYFKREILVLAACLTSFYSLMLNLIIFGIFMMIFGVNFNLSNLYAIPIIALLFLLSIGTSFILSSFYTKFRDLNYIWQFILQIGFFLTPIIYSIEIIPAKYLRIYNLNPMGIIMTESRKSLIYHLAPNFNSWIILSIIAVMFVTLGHIIFKKKSQYFVEEL